MPVFHSLLRYSPNCTFFGSKKIPDLARSLGKGMREMNDAMQGIQRDIKDGMNLDEEKKIIDDAKKEIRSLKDDIE